MRSPDVLIVGAGVAGLACGLTLKQAGRNVLIVEAADEVGGRVRSYKSGDFVLDRGFQVLLAAYPTCRQLLNYDALKLGAFHPGALIKLPSGIEVSIGDPFRRLRDLIPTLRAPVGSFRDKCLVAKLRFQSRYMRAESVWKMPNVATASWLRDYGFSPAIIDHFFRPFLSGVFLESKLETSARMFHFVYRFFTLGNAALPAGGMGQIPRQMADRVESRNIILNARVTEVQSGRVKLEDGRDISAPKIVIAVDGDQARKWFPAMPERSWVGGTCYYFDAPASPFAGRRKKLWLNATGQGRINHIAVPSDVASGYAPPGRSLISVNTVGDGDHPAGEDVIKPELRALFGEQITHWKFLRRYPVPRSLPRLEPGDLERTAARRQLPPGMFVCGDVLGAGSLETAMGSGVAVARECLAS